MHAYYSTEVVYILCMHMHTFWSAQCMIYYLHEACSIYACTTRSVAKRLKSIMGNMHTTLVLYLKKRR